MILAHQSDPFGLPAFVVSMVAISLSGLTFALATTTFVWNIRVWRHSGARVKVTGTAKRGASEQYIDVAVRNTGRAPITVNAVLLYAAGRGRQPDREAPTLYLGSEKDGQLADLKPHRLEGYASIELPGKFQRGTPMYGLPRYWVDVELATGRTITTRWFKSN